MFNQLFKDKPIFVNIIINFLIFITVLTISFYLQREIFSSKYTYADDAEQHMYFLYQIKNPNLFKNDLLTEYAKYYQSPGYLVFYFTLSYFFDPLLITKISGVVLYALCLFLIFKIGLLFVNKIYASILFFFFLLTKIFILRINGGFARSFFMPFLLLFLYNLNKKNIVASSFSILLLGLFYPVGYIICLPIFLIYSFVHRNLIRSRQKILLIILIIILPAIYYLNKNIFYSSHDFGQLVNIEQMKNNIEYTDKGRFQVIPTLRLDQEYLSLLNAPNYNLLSSLLQNNLIIAWVISLFLLIYLIHRKTLFLLLFFSIIVYFAANFFLIKLFLPERYLEYTIPLLFVFFYTDLIYGISRIFIILNWPKIRIIYFIIILTLIFSRLQSINKLNYEFSGNKKSLFNYLKQLPINSLIAAHPYIADDIPLFTQRKVFINFELSHPIYYNYWQTIKIRTYDFFDMYYSSNLDKVRIFCKKNSVDYILIKTEHFDNNYLTNKQIYFEPFNTYIRNTYSHKSYFILNEYSKDHSIITWQDYRLINCSII